MNTIGQHSLIQHMERLIAETPGGRTTFFNLKEFPWVPEVEAHWAGMRAELARLMQAVDYLPGFEEIQTEQLQLSRDKRWKIFPLYVYGERYNAARCPAAMQALSHIPGLKVAMFSILQAGKELPPHRGPYSGVLRYHLGLEVPDPALCGIRVRTDVQHWEEGRSMIFDDSHEHAAWNRGSRDRIVLFVDFARPLPAALQARNEFVIEQISQSDFVRQAAARWSAWEKTHGAAIDARIAAALI